MYRKRTNGTDSLATYLDSRHRRRENQRIEEVELAIDKYHIKVLTGEVLQRGLGLFATDLGHDTSDVGPGIEHMSRALNLLFAVPELRKHVVSPFAVRAPIEGEDDGYYRVIYENLLYHRYA